MIVILGLFVVLCLYGMKITCSKEKLADYLSIQHTQSIKGIFILLVFFSHFNSYVQLNSTTDQIYKYIIGLFGQTMVTMFLFYSGYGVMESIQKKGIHYVQQMPVKRILATLFKFDCAVLLFAALCLVLGDRFTTAQFFLSLIGWESLGNSNWYIFVVLLLYCFTYVAFATFGKKGLDAPALVVLILTLLYLVIFCVFDIKASYWYDTALCYAMGMLYSLHRKRIETYINKNRLTYLLSLAISGGIFLVSMKLYTVPLMFYVRYFSFTATVVIATMRITLNNRGLQFFGKNLFEIYILQRIPMIVFYHLRWVFNPVIYFIMCAATTVVIMFPFKWITDQMWKKICMVLYRLNCFGCDSYC